MTDKELMLLPKAELADLVTEAAREVSAWRSQLGGQFDCSLADNQRTNEEADAMERLLREAAQRLRDTQA